MAVLAPRADTMAPGIGVPPSSRTTPPIDPEASDAIFVTAAGADCPRAAGSWKRRTRPPPAAAITLGEPVIFYSGFTPVLLRGGGAGTLPSDSTAYDAL